MNSYQLANYYNLQTGDRLIRTKGIVSTHHGIYIGIYNGVPMVAENQSGHGVRYVNLDTFLNNNSLKEIRRFSGTEQARNNIIPRINNLLGTPYDLINFNCEHFAELVLSGRAKSNQVDNVMAGLALFAFVGLASLFAGE